METASLVAICVVGGVADGEIRKVEVRRADR